MKPEEARAMRRRQDRARAARGKALEDYLQSGEPTDRVVPETIPDEVALTVALRDARGLMRQARLTPRSQRRTRIVDDLRSALHHLIYVERVMAMDPLERAALTPARLAELSLVAPDELRTRGSKLLGTEVPS